MHDSGDVAFHKMRFVAVTPDQVGQFLAADAREYRRICDLEPVEMKDRKNRAIARGIEKLVGVPTRGKCAVSASPSPMMQATIRSGLSNAAP